MPLTVKTLYYWFSFFTGYPTITDITFGGYPAPFILTCTSTGSPPTTIMWQKDGHNITVDGSKFKLARSIVNRRASIYDNILTIDDEYANLLGTFSCRVENEFGSSYTKTVDAVGEC